MKETRLLEHAWLLILLLAAGWPVAPARAAEPGDGATERGSAASLAGLNRKALAELRAGKFEAAKDVLLEALVVGKEAGPERSHDLARTYAYLAYLYIAGEKNRDRCAKQWTMTLQIDPDFAVPAELDTPAMRSAYLLARRQLGLAATPAAPAPAPAPTTSSSPAAKPAAAPVPAPASASAAPVIVSRRGRGGHRVQIRRVDPDLPARVPSPLYCPLPFEIPPGEDLVVRCVTQKQARKSTAKLYYRAEGAPSDDFIAAEMSRGGKGWLQATIPADAIEGKSLAYYVEAHVPAQGSEEGKVLYLGSPPAPNAFLIREGADAALGSEDEDILATLNTTIADEDDTFRYHRRGPSSLWVSLAGGSGAAYHGTEFVDSGDTSGGNAIRSVAGLTGAGLVQTELEIGYQFTKRLSLSLMGRYQYAPTDSSGYTGRPILSTALAAYVRGRYAFLTAGNFQALASAGLGGGRNFLVIVDKQCDANSPTPGCKLTHSDTLHGGPVGALVGVGAAYHLSRSFAVFLDVSEIVTFGKLMALTEVNLGLAVAFAIESAKPPAADEGVAAEKPLDTAGAEPASDSDESPASE